MKIPSKFLVILLLIGAMSIIIIFLMATAVKFFPGWLVNVTFVWLVFLAGYAMGRFSK